ncbi:MAG: hypothetical protein HQM14_13475 [SAR324 cluster bacterium]|nr:hypothetical protein [SAR324 cluster bacterium]
MIFQKNKGFFLFLICCLSFVVGCGSSKEEDDSEAKAAFNESDVIIDQGSVDELEYEVRDSAIRFVNPTTHPATLTQYNEAGEIVDVHSIRTQDTTEFVENLLQGNSDDGIETHRLIHEDAVTGEIFFKGEYSVVAEVVGLIRSVLSASLLSSQTAICFFSQANLRTDHLLEQLEKDVSGCFDNYAELQVEKISILDNLTSIVLSSSTTSSKKTIKLRADE